MNRAQRRAQGMFTNASKLRQIQQSLMQQSTVAIRCLGPCNKVYPIPFGALSSPYVFCEAIREIEWEVGEAEGEVPGTRQYVVFCEECKKQSVEGFDANDESQEIGEE